MFADNTTGGLGAEILRRSPGWFATGRWAQAGYLGWYPQDLNARLISKKKWGFPWGFRRIHFAKLVEFTRITLGFMVITTYYNSNSWDLQSTSVQGGHLVAMRFKNMATWWCVFWFYGSSIDVLFSDVFSKDGDFVPVQLRQNTGISPSDADFIKLAWFLFCNKVGFEPGIIFIFFSTEELDLSNHWCI